MRYMPKCKKCGSILLQRDLAKIDKDWARRTVDGIRALTGQTKVFQRICPVCYPDKVKAFVNRERI